MDKLISVIVPCYNSVKYIDRCISSLIHQKYNNFEIIVVNDGSTDGSLKKIKYWCSLDCRIHVFNQKNLGRSTARNKGISVSNGEYVTFVDSDDYVSTHYLAHLAMGLTNGEEISMNHLVLMDENNNIVGKKRNWKFNLKRCTGKQGLHRILNQNPDSEVCGKMFSIKLFRDLRFPTGLIYEDFLTCIRAMILSKRVSYIDFPDYYYCQHRNNTMNSPFNYKKMDIVKIGDDVEKTVLNKYPDLKSPVMGRLFAAYANVWLQIDNNSEYDYYYNFMWNKMMECRRQIIIGEIDNSKVLSGVIISFFGKSAFKRVYKIMSK